MYIFYNEFEPSQKANAIVLNDLNCSKAVERRYIEHFIAAILFFCGRPNFLSFVNTMLVK